MKSNTQVNILDTTLPDNLISLLKEFNINQSHFKQDLQNLQLNQQQIIAIANQINSSTLKKIISFVPKGSGYLNNAEATSFFNKIPKGVMGKIITYNQGSNDSAALAKVLKGNEESSIQFPMGNVTHNEVIYTPYCPKQLKHVINGIVNGMELLKAIKSANCTPKEIEAFLNNHHNTSLSVTDEGGNSALHCCAGLLCCAELLKDYKIVEVLMRYEANPHMKNNITDYTPWTLAAASGHIAMVTSLMKAGVDVNTRDTYGGTALHQAASYGHNNTIKILIEAGAEVDAQDEKGETPVHVAVPLEQINSIEILIEAGADVNIKDEDGLTALHKAAQEDKPIIVEYLAKQPWIDLNLQDKDGNTALHLADGSEWIMGILCHAGANVHIRNNHNDLAQDVQGFHDITDLLFAYQTINDTVVHKAVKLRDINKLKNLIQNGSDVKAKNEYKTTPLHIAAENGDAAIVEMLIQAGANVNDKVITAAINQSNACILKMIQQATQKKAKEKQKVIKQQLDILEEKIKTLGEETLNKPQSDSIKKRDAKQKDKEEKILTKQEKNIANNSFALKPIKTSEVIAAPKLEESKDDIMKNVIDSKSSQSESCGSKSDASNSDQGVASNNNLYPNYSEEDGELENGESEEDVNLENEKEELLEEGVNFIALPEEFCEPQQTIQNNPETLMENNTDPINHENSNLELLGATITR